MSNLIDKIEKKLLGHLKLLIAYSGGLDSTVLLHQLMLLRNHRPELKLRAIHINHGISPAANCWAQHCYQQCKIWQIPLKIIKINQLDIKQGIEAAARIARYNVFKKVLLKGEILLTAQHLDDQCETFLLALKRGSGPAGLAAMPSEIKIGNNIFLRPMLYQTRQDIEEWALKHQLKWVNDQSNFDTRFDRNFLRIKILPSLKKRWPSFLQAVARSSQLCAEQEQLLEELLTESLDKLTQPDKSLKIDILHNYSKFHRYGILRKWLAKKNIIPSRNILQCIWHQVICSRKDASPCLKIGKYEIRRYRHAIYLINIMPPIRDDVLHWSSPWEPLKLPQNLGTIKMKLNNHGITIRSPLKGEQVTIRFKIKGKFYVLGRMHSKPIKKLWQEYSVPPWLRERIPLIFYNDKLIAALGVFITNDGKSNFQDNWCISWEKKIDY
ncbi:MAG: tRNA lysidine(34) synthetase TilS [Candidatus Dasytiphilus stammeri]